MIQSALKITVTLLALGWIGGMFWYAEKVPRRATADDRPTDAIIVLTGGSMRLGHGFRLMREHKAKELLITGVGEGVTLAELLSQQSQESLKDALDSRVISLDYAAISTATNATAADAWMKSRKFRSARIVTANYHMPRALREFSAVMPEATLYPDPVFPEKEFHLERWYADPASVKLLAAEFLKYAVISVRGIGHPPSLPPRPGA